MNCNLCQLGCPMPRIGRRAGRIHVLRDENEGTLLPGLDSYQRSSLGARGLKPELEFRRRHLDDPALRACAAPRRQRYGCAQDLPGAVEFPHGILHTFASDDAAGAELPIGAKLPGHWG